jgi:GH15 family glucan-1,4-alpha-glucosidase
LARTTVTGNGSILAAADASGTLREIYVPSIEPQNQILRRPARIGLWTDGRLTWLPGPFEARPVESGSAPIVAHSLASADLGLEVWIELFVDVPLGVVVRRVQVTNLSERHRDLRILFHHDFALEPGEPQETAEHDEESGGVLHHAGHRCVLVNLESREHGVPLWRVLARGSATASGAEALPANGRIDGGPPARGLVDSIAACALPVAPGESGMVSARIVFGETVREARARDAAFRAVGAGASAARARSHWNLWLKAGAQDGLDLPEEVALLYERSLVTLRLHQTPEGAIVGGFEPEPDEVARQEVRWCWNRDAAIAADALDRAGYPGSARSYFMFAARSARAHDGLHAAVRNDGAPAAAPDDPDALALPLWALARHFDRGRDVEFISPILRDLVHPTADRLVEALDETTRLPAGLDLWGERIGIHASTAAVVRAGLLAAARLAAAFDEPARASRWAHAADAIARAVARDLYHQGSGRFARSAVREGRSLRTDPTVDASLLWLGLFGDFEPEDSRIRATVDAVRNTLWVRTGVGGVARYERDPLGSVGTDLAEVPGSPSIAATLWLAQHAIRTARRWQDLDPVRTVLLWCASRVEGAGYLPARLHPYRGATSGPSPSLVAHVWFVATVLDYRERLRSLRRCERCGAPARDEREREPIMLPDSLSPRLVAHT